MAAINPQRVKDLLHRFGSDFIPRLAALGVNYQGEAQILFVDNGSANALDADDTVHGMSFFSPLATIDYAIGLCTANEGSVILVAPGHNENLGNATIDFDVTGITCIGLGNGDGIPRIDFEHANSSIDIGANSITLINFRFLPSVSGVLKGIDVESGATNFKLVNCEFQVGEDGAGGDEFIKAIALTSGNHDSIFENVKILAHASAGEATHGIHVVAASDRLTFKNVIIDGPYATGGIVEAAAGVNHVVEDCSVDTTGTNYSFHASSTFAKRTRNLSGGTLEDTGETLIGVNDADNNVNTSSVVANIDGSVLERLEDIKDKVVSVNTTAISAAPTAKTLADILSKDGSCAFSKATDSLEALRDRLDSLVASLPTQYLGTAETNVTATTIISADLAGYGDAFFVTDWVAVCVKDAGGAAPEGEIRDITGYTSATGTFATAAFTAAVTVGDEVLIARRELFSIDEVTLKTPVANSLAAFIASGGTGLGTNLPASTSLYDTTKNVSTVGVTGAPVAKTLADILHKDGTFAYDHTTDSLEALRDKSDADIGTLVNTGGTASIGGILGNVSNKSVATRLGDIETDTAELQPRAANVATKTITNLSGGLGNYNMFTVSGPVKVVAILGIVANTIKDAAINAKIVAVPTDPGNEVDVTATVNIQAKVAGTTFTPGATFGAALVATPNGVIGSMGFTFVMNSGVIALDIDAAGDADDSIVWYVRYEPLSATATIVAA